MFAPRSLPHQPGFDQTGFDQTGFALQMEGFGLSYSCVWIQFHRKIIIVLLSWRSHVCNVTGLNCVHSILLADVEVVERGTDELQGLVQGVSVQATRVKNVHPKAYVPEI